MARKLQKINSLPNLNLARMRKKNASIEYFSLKASSDLIKKLKTKTYFIRTYGCSSNVRDSEILSGILKEIGLKPANDLFHADLVILNTCAIRENAELKVFGEIGFLKQIKNKNPDFVFGICGCMSQEENTVKKICEKINHVDFVIGTHNIHKIINVLEDVYLKKQQVIDVWSKEGDVIEKLPSLRSSKVKALVNIMYGCDQFCTYCIVPYTRGKIRSRQPQEILQEIKDLIKEGYQEVSLLGQNVNSYGVDFKDQKYRFADLLADVAQTGIKRIRFATSNPWNFDQEIIDVVKKYDNIMPYFHLPIQSGSEQILEKMNRSMKLEDYLTKITYLKNTLKNVAISTDIIVGFPNETEDDFLKTLNLYHQVKFDNAYTFIYSKRPGTPAAMLSDNVSLEDKKKRLLKLNELVKKYAKWNNEKYLDQEVEVLVEGVSKTNKNTLTGYSPQWKVVNFTGNAHPGDFVIVKIISANCFSLNGKMIRKL